MLLIRLYYTYKQTSRKNCQHDGKPLQNSQDDFRLHSVHIRFFKALICSSCEYVQGKFIMVKIRRAIEFWIETIPLFVKYVEKNYRKRIQA